MIASRSLKKETKKKCTAKSCSIEACDCKEVIIKTSEGLIKIELNPDKAPNTVKNFISYVKKGHYNGTIFHRVISNFMIQGGEHTLNNQQKKPGEAIKSEANNGLKNETGTIAMARTNDPDSAKAQFFINVRNNPFLNYSDKKPGYTVFGKVTEGMDVVNKIRIAKTDNKNWPIKPTVMEKVELV